MGHPMQRNRSKGFSLMELMIAVAIVGIIAAVGYPSYQDHITRSNRNEAVLVLQDIGAAMENYAMRTGNYSVTNLAAVYTLDASQHPAVDRYTFSLTRSATSWAVTATPTGAQSGDGALILYWDGRRGWDSNSDGTYEPYNP